MEKRDYEVLEDIYKTVNDWLKFAESKNAALILFMGASTTAFFTYMNIESSNQTLAGKLYTASFLFFALLGIVTSLFSFAPQTKVFKTWRKINNKKNIYYFGDLAYMSPEEIIEKIYNKNKDEKVSLIRKNIAEQIHNNARICEKKLFFFRVALWFAIAAIVTPFVSLILYFIFDPHWSNHEN